MKKVRRKSIRFRFICLVTMAVGVLVVMMFFNNVYAMKVVREQVTDTNAKLLTLYVNRLDDAFEDMGNYWVGLQTSNNFLLSERDDDSVSYHKALARLKMDMENAIPSYGYTDALFVYFKDSNNYMDAAKYSLAGSNRTAVKEKIQELVEEEVPQEKQGNWFGVEVDGDYYLIRFFRVRQAYMGGYVRVTELLEKIRNDGFGEADYLAFCQNDGQELGNELPALKAPLTLDDRKTYDTLEGENTRYLMLAKASSCGDYSLVAMIRENQVVGALQSLQSLFIWLIVGIGIFLFLVTAVVKRWLIRPLDNLTSAMRRLSEGDLGIRLEQNVDCEEFAVVNQTFDNMIEQIQTLKIDVYEEKVRHQKEKVQRQKAELQYMKLQINPHFYINCLNVIHSLSLMNRNELVQKMTNYLGNHLRYTLEGNSLDFLWKEIDYVKNYLKIQEMRFGDSIESHFEIDEKALDVLVPPLIIQTFVENTIKYQVVPGEVRNIYIRIRRDPEMEIPGIRLEIWDDGDGFSERILTCLEKGIRIFDENGEHYGIGNVCQRMKLLYQGKEKVSFSNHPKTGGAYILMQIPELEKEEGGPENHAGVTGGR